MLNFLPMPLTVSIVQPNVIDEWGVTSVSTKAQKFRAKINYNSSNESISLTSGELIRYQANILIEGSAKITYRDFVVWIDEFGNSHKKQPLEISFKYDLSGNSVAIRVVV